jgi:hypothetical protein
MRVGSIDLQKKRRTKKKSIDAHIYMPCDVMSSGYISVGLNTIAFRSISERYRCDYTEIDAL